MSDNKHPDTPLKGTEADPVEDKAIAAAYRQLAQESPSKQVDSAILSAAAAVSASKYCKPAGNKQMPKRQAKRGIPRFWYPTFASAAVVVVAVSVVFSVKDDPYLTEAIVDSSNEVIVAADEAHHQELERLDRNEAPKKESPQGVTNTNKPLAPSSALPQSSSLASPTQAVEEPLQAPAEEIIISSESTSRNRVKTELKKVKGSILAEQEIYEDAETSLKPVGSISALIITVDELKQLLDDNSSKVYWVETNEQFHLFNIQGDQRRVKLPKDQAEIKPETLTDRPLTSESIVWSDN